jgi:hypothetical protein
MIASWQIFFHCGVSQLTKKRWVCLTHPDKWFAIVIQICPFGLVQPICITLSLHIIFTVVSRESRERESLPVTSLLHHVEKKDLVVVEEDASSKYP